jgi:hypothetical protein
MNLYARADEICGHSVPGFGCLKDDEHVVTTRASGYFSSVSLVSYGKVWQDKPGTERMPLPNKKVARFFILLSICNGHKVDMGSTINRTRSSIMLRTSNVIMRCTQQEAWKFEHLLDDAHTEEETLQCLYAQTSSRMLDLGHRIPKQ